MSFADRLGVVGVIVALIGIAAVYLWPDKKWIGWICLAAAGLMIIGWSAFEAKTRLGETRLSSIVAIALGAIFGGFVAWAIWTSIPAKTQQAKSGPQPAVRVGPAPTASPTTAPTAEQHQPTASEIAEELAKKLPVKREVEKSKDESVATNDQVEVKVKRPRKSPSGNAAPSSSSSTLPQNSGTSVPTTQNCPNGICIGGSNLGTATVNNYSPVIPPRRTMANNKLAQITDALKVTGNPKVSVMIVSDEDGESTEFGNQVVSSFEKGGWQVIPFRFSDTKMDFISDKGTIRFRGEGLHCYASDSSLLDTVVSAFKTVDLQCKTDIPIPLLRESDVVVVIGQR